MIGSFGQHRELILVSGVRQALAVATVRNTCRRYMTNDRSWISPIRQIRWWRNARKDPSLHLFLMRVDGWDVGYGIVATKNGEIWVSGGLIDEERGKGHGRWLFEELTKVGARMGSSASLAEGPVYLEVFRANIRAQALYESLGYQFIRWRNPGVAVMRYGPTSR